MYVKLYDRSLKHGGRVIKSMIGIFVIQVRHCFLIYCQTRRVRNEKYMYKPLDGVAPPTPT